MAEIVVTPTQVLVGAVSTLTAAFYGEDGNPTEPGIVTVGVTDLTGATVVAAGATVAGATGVRTYALPAPAALDLYDVTWTTANLGAFTARVEVVGAFLFSVREARAYDKAALANPQDYPTEVIVAARERITNEFELICGVSFVPRVTRVVLDGYRASVLDLDATRVTAIRAVETRVVGATDWTAFDAGQLADVLLDAYGMLRREVGGAWPDGRGTVRVTYEHGDVTPPADIKRAALEVCRQQLSEGNVSQRILSRTTDMGTEQYSTPSLEHDRPYGLIYVDPVLVRHREGRVAIA